jgi:DNA-binding response OmpR family regulator
MDMKKKRILIVDDEATIRELLADLLHLRKIGCDGAADSGEALSLLSQKRYALVLLDYHLGKEEAPDIIERIREKCGSTPIVLLTGSADSDECDPKKLGVADLIRKPFHFDAVMALVESYLELQ